jgi:hypothetical protein
MEEVERRNAVGPPHTLIWPHRLGGTGRGGQGDDLTTAESLAGVARARRYAHGSATPQKDRMKDWPRSARDRMRADSLFRIFSGADRDTLGRE